MAGIDVNDVISKLQAKVKQSALPVAPEPPPPEPPPPQTASEEQACVYKEFKRLIDALPSSYIGSAPLVKEYVVTMLNPLKEC